MKKPRSGSHDGRERARLSADAATRPQAATWTYYTLIAEARQLAGRQGDAKEAPETLRADWRSTVTTFASLLVTLLFLRSLDWLGTSWDRGRSLGAIALSSGGFVSTIEWCDEHKAGIAGQPSGASVGSIDGVLAELLPVNVPRRDECSPARRYCTSAVQVSSWCWVQARSSPGHHLPPTRTSTSGRSAGDGPCAAPPARARERPQTDSPLSSLPCCPCISDRLHVIPTERLARHLR